jgi:hypothetical protein
LVGRAFLLKACGGGQALKLHLDWHNLLRPPDASTFCISILISSGQHLDSTAELHVLNILCRLLIRFISGIFESVV